ncbi:putative alpha-N-acetylglucosaminidase [Talaromyces proteolyticus]|uniref:Alpha-N-acetylglucosaminidase n=1 Tax=Talaromyces proteolyticus TaxID=1131652 RepID=A0AAD4PXT3_9EURO|nr:putative alpha-N-acetylglucosaminidase [Talaromyces proteolyticus]KAH8696754.1 putative alpha-N-acetylglucosaminidase [Talaromyces proteolyticus]
MRYLSGLAWGWLGTVSATSQTISTQGIYDLVKRRIPQHVDSFEFSLVNATPSVVLSASEKPNDQFVVSTSDDGKILVEGNSISALSSGMFIINNYHRLHKYLSDIAHVGIYWYIGNRLDLAPSELPRLNEPLKGSSVVPWRYDLNTVTFSYTASFWDWEEWELQLDWMSLHGVNLPLAWVGFEKTLVEVFQEIGLTDAEIFSFLSSPAFQAWNRFGNIQGSWGGELPYSWIENQFNLQKQIVARMAELGMTPVLPAFTGFVPRAITRVFPNASVVEAPSWGNFPPQYSNDSFLEPLDDHFGPLQNSFISKQKAAYGNVTNIYALDQYNEINPFSGNTTYLTDIAASTINSLKAADPNAIWMMQGWLFYEAESFWTADRIEAYLSGVANSGDMLILDLFSESKPQWQRTDSYHGKPWIWCMVHDYGGNQGIYGQIENITQNSMQALASSPSMVGLGLTMEGQEGNEVVYDLLLHQAWSETPVDTEQYFHNWVTARYAGSGSIPQGLYHGWEILRATAYNNTNLTASICVTRSIFVNEPAISGLLDWTGFDPTIVVYDPADLVQVWKYVFEAAAAQPALWSNPSYQYDLVDITRQVMANGWGTIYADLCDLYAQSNASSAEIYAQGAKMIGLLNSIDTVLSTNRNFQLSRWIDAARAWAQGNESEAAYYEYSARNQITLWGPNGEIDTYAAKDWSGLVSTYYVPKWQIFVEYLASTPTADYNQTELHSQVLAFELKWQTEPLDIESKEQDLQYVVKQVVEAWPDLFSG